MLASMEEDMKGEGPILSLPQGLHSGVVYVCVSVTQAHQTAFLELRNLAG